MTPQAKTQWRKAYNTNSMEIAEIGVRLNHLNLTLLYSDRHLTTLRGGSTLRGVLLICLNGGAEKHRVLAIPNTYNTYTVGEERGKVGGQSAVQCLSLPSHVPYHSLRSFTRMVSSSVTRFAHSLGWSLSFSVVLPVVPRRPKTE